MNLELVSLPWTDPNPRGGCYLCHRALRFGDDAVQLDKFTELLSNKAKKGGKAFARAYPPNFSGAIRIDREWIGTAHSKCAHEAGYTVVKEIYAVVERVPYMSQVHSPLVLKAK